MAFSGFSRDIGNTTSGQAFDPSERNIDAENLNFEQLLRLFEPNDLRKLCSYDRMSLFGGPTYLVAERGVGKTHILKLLYEVMRKRGDVALWVDQKDNPISATFDRLKIENPRDKKTVLWQIAILEESSILIVKQYLDFIQSSDFRKIPGDVRRKFRREFLRGLEKYFTYVKEYRKDEWAIYHRFLNATQQGLIKIGNASRWVVVQVIVETIRRLMSRPISQSPLNLTLVNAVSADASDKTDSQSASERVFMTNRLLQLEEWFWPILRSLGSLKYPANDGQGWEFTKHLPNSHSVFVIADGLDQTLQPMSHSDILALYLATRYLNRKCPGEQIENFKVIMGIRAITYNYYVQPKDPDRGQMYTDVEILTWSKDALKLMMARRILESDQSLVNLTPDQILKKRFPDEVHYFGHRESALDFVFSVTAYRPRQIIILWRKCAEMVNEKDRAFSIVIDEDLLVNGFQQYSISTLPDDIAEEYSSEYTGLDSLLEFLAANRHLMPRKIRHDDFSNIIEQFIKKIPRPGRKSLNWITNNSADVLQVLYQTGIIGIPTGETDNDWAKHKHVFAHPNLNVSNYPVIYIRPHMWTFLTDIQDEITRRRKYLVRLFQEMKSCVENLDTLFGNQDAAQKRKFEYEISRFMALGYMVKNYPHYPEPVDWRELEKIEISIKQSWNDLSLFATWKIDRNQEGFQFIEGLAESLQKIMIISTYPSDFQIQTAPSFNLNNPDYVTASSPLRPWLDAYANKSKSETFEKFSQLLVNSPQSLNNVLGRAIDTIKPLTQ